MVLRKPTSRLLLLAAALAVALVVPATVSALTLIGTAGPDVLRGSNQGDKIFGLGAGDRLYGLAGNDTLVGGSGRDSMYGGPGNDTLQARDGEKDIVDCGPGKDVAVVDTVETAIVGCETVQRPGKCQGCRSNPIRFGVFHDIGRGWSVKVTSVLPNANQRIISWSSSNNPPRAGHQFYMVTLAAKRTGKVAGYLHAGFYMRAVGPRGVEYNTFEDSCGDLPDTDLETDDRRVFPGTTIDGNICWEVFVNDVPKLVMFSSPGKEVFFALNG
jgi:hypothetical protein